MENSKLNESPALKAFSIEETGMRADYVAIKIAQENERRNMENVVKNFVRNEDWRKIIEQNYKKTGIIELDPETQRIFDNEVAKGNKSKITAKSSLDDVLDFLEKERIKNYKWAENFGDLKDNLSKGYYRKVDFRAGWVNQDISNPQYNQTINNKAIDELIEEYQNAYQQNFGRRSLFERNYDDRYNLSGKSEEEKEAIRKDFYDRFLRDYNKESQQYDKVQALAMKDLDFDDHPEAARYQFLAQAYHNTELIDDPNVKALIEHVKQDSSIPEDKKVEAFLTLSDNNLVRDGLLDPSESKYYDPNFSISAERQRDILEQAGLMPSDNPFTNVFSDPLKGLRQMLPPELQKSFEKVNEAFNQLQRGEDIKPVELNVLEREYIKKAIPEDKQAVFDDVYQVVSQRDNLSPIEQMLQRANQEANEARLSNVELSKVQEAVASMVNNGRNEENMNTLTNNAELGQKLVYTQENKLDNRLDNQYKMRLNPR